MISLKALGQQIELLKLKRLCEENGVRLVEWPYDVEPTGKNILRMME